jgi:hypothetical protein
MPLKGLVKKMVERVDGLEARFDALDDLSSRSDAEITRKTKMYRTIMRAQDDPQRNPSLGRAMEKLLAEYHKPERWARRIAATDPRNAGKLRFDPEGNLVNKVSPSGKLLD